MAHDPRSGPPEEEQTSITTQISAATLLGRGKTRQLKPYLVVLMGTNVGETFRLDGGEVFLGRSPSSTVRFDDDGVSRKHARVWQMPGTGEWMLEDLGSANGTLVNSERVSKTKLANNDKIQLGPSTLLKFTYHDEVEENFQKQMYDAALRDGLTKAYNKKYFLTRLDTELAYARRHKSTLSLVMLDVDHFKRINDTHGHLAGDSVLIALSQLIARTIRTEDVFARYGGEEFAVICRGVSCEAAAVMAERLRQLVAAHKFEIGGTSSIPVSISLGLAGVPEYAAESSVQLIAAADEALYSAKGAGRNRVARYDPRR